MNVLQKNIIIRLFKIIDISMIGILYLLLGIISALFINNLLYQKEFEDKNERRSSIFYVLKILIRTSFIMISAYLIRNIIMKVPVFFDGIYGYKHTRIKELSGGVIIAFSIISFQPQYKKDIEALIKKFDSKYGFKFLKYIE